MRMTAFLETLYRGGIVLLIHYLAIFIDNHPLSYEIQEIKKGQR